MNEPRSPSKFQQKLAERKEREAAERAAEEALRQELAADVPEDPYSLSEADKALDSAIERIDILTAYDRYIGKTRDTPRKGQRESIMISCPAPWHPDADPSAWINLDKQTWYCGKCDLGGDAQDFAAIAKGLAWPKTYKTDGTFHKLREGMAEDFGFHFTKLPGGVISVEEPEQDKPDKPDNPEQTVQSLPKPDNSDTGTAEPEPSSSDAQIIDLFEEDENILIPKFDWSKIVEPDTYLHAYMKATKIDDVPLEYHLFHALLGLGMALGRDVSLFDSAPVYGNLFVCTLGRSGSGKSRAKNHLDKLLNAALPHNWSDDFSKGTVHIEAPGSAEVLIHSFQKPIMDPSNPKNVVALSPVRGLITFNELSSLVSRTGRVGSALKPTMMQLYDMQDKISTRSLTHGIKEAQHPFASAITSTQPKALKDLLGTADDASGFLNRWVYILGNPKKRFAIGGAAIDMAPVVPHLESIFGWAGTFTSHEQIYWSDEAAERFTQFFHDQIERDKSRIDNDMMVRIDLVLKKLILLFTANVKQKTVPLKAVEAAIELYPYLLAGFALSAAQIIRTVAGDIQQAVLNIAQKQYKLDGKGITLRQISKSLWRRNYNAEQLHRTIDALVKMGMLKVVQQNIGATGRPTVRYKYVD